MHACSCPVFGKMNRDMLRSIDLFALKGYFSCAKLANNVVLEVWKFRKKSFYLTSSFSFVASKREVWIPSLEFNQRFCENYRKSLKRCFLTNRSNFRGKQTYADAPLHLQYAWIAMLLKSFSSYANFLFTSWIMLIAWWKHFTSNILSVIALFFDVSLRKNFCKSACECETFFSFSTGIGRILPRHPRDDLLFRVDQFFCCLFVTQNIAWPNTPAYSLHGIWCGKLSSNDLFLVIFCPRKKFPFNGTIDIFFTYSRENVAFFPESIIRSDSRCIVLSCPR